jgi:GNAT superfamily N-acetyltransferase
MHRICVAPDFKGGAWPRALFGWAEDEARRLGRPYLRLDCFPRPKLRAVYEANGFEKVDDRWVHYLYVYRYERPVRPQEAPK